MYRTRKQHGPANLSVCEQGRLSSKKQHRTKIHTILEINPVPVGGCPLRRLSRNDDGCCFYPILRALDLIFSYPFFCGNAVSEWRGGGAGFCGRLRLLAKRSVSDARKAVRCNKVKRLMQGIMALGEIRSAYPIRSRRKRIFFEHAGSNGRYKRRGTNMESKKV